MKKKTKVDSTTQKSQDMLSEYDFDYHEAKPNRFAGRMSNERVVAPSEFVNRSSSRLNHRLPESLKGGGHK